MIILICYSLILRSVSNLVCRNTSWNSIPRIFSLLKRMPEESTQTTHSTTDASDNTTDEITESNESAAIDRNITRLPPIVIYTDGSCVENYASGIGIYFGPNHPLNKSKAIKGHKHNSGLAEIIAAKTALKLLRKWNFYKGENVILRTDFLPLIYAMNKDGFNGRFHTEYSKLKQLASRFPNGVQFEHVFGHEGEHGNEEANNLARRATMDARLARSLSAPPFRNVSRNREFLIRRRSRSRNRSSRARLRNRTCSRRINSSYHRRSRSAYISGTRSKR
ncbi:unnamed protein product [Cercopithifilaria johnstoni]|uniref:ribonuclease H n=1 Tax=Cercopithifilaria johnstoni TaxID=2874296 RepID=A0A8J2MU36_9BILA|nr:unnamed protein product [Cercopithifilaria johnstoni]